MPNVAKVLKLEMKRVASKEVRASGLAPKVKALNRRIRALEKRLKALEARPVALPAPVPAEAPATVPLKKGRRFMATPAVFKRVRAKIGVTQAELAQLLGVSHSAVYQWEAGRIKPREQTASTLQALEGIGKREARQRLIAK